MSTDIENMLRESLTAAATATPAAPDPWTGFAARERTHRRSRRTRLAVAAVAVVAAVGVQTNVLPLPGWAPGIAVAGGPTALTGSPARGSLAADRAWQRGMRRVVKDVEDPGELWRVDNRDKIRFVYAGDVAGRRLALMLVPLRFGFLTDSMLTWYEGPAGAAPGQMTDAARVDRGETVVTYAETADDRAGLAIIVAPAGSTVSISAGFSYSAAGRVEHTAPVVSAPGSGVGVLTLPPQPAAPGITGTVTQDGRTLYRGPLAGGWSGTSDISAVPDAVIGAALGDRTFDRAMLREWVSGSLSDARLPAEGTAVAVRWTGTVDGQAAALYTLQPRNGGVLAYAVHGAGDNSRQDLRLLLPAAGVTRRAIAWRMRAPGRDDRTGQVVVVAPPGATRVDLAVAGRAATTVPLDAGGAGRVTLAPDATASVIAYAADGSRMSATPVPPFETDGGGLPGDTPKTRIVP